MPPRPRELSAEGHFLWTKAINTAAHKFSEVLFGVRAGEEDAGGEGDEAGLDEGDGQEA